mgnify:CR=1 FL=1
MFLLCIAGGGLKNMGNGKTGTIMKKTLILLTAALVSGSVMAAVSPVFKNSDTNKDGKVTVIEYQTFKMAAAKKYRLNELGMSEKEFLQKSPHFATHFIKLFIEQDKNRDGILTDTECTK